jgi:hypothetical protein
MVMPMAATLVFTQSRVFYTQLLQLGVPIAVELCGIFVKFRS